MVHILKLLTVEKFQTSNTRKKIGYLYQGVYVAMGSMDFILIKRNGNYKMEKPRILKKKPNNHYLHVYKIEIKFILAMIFDVLIDIFQVISCTVQ